MRVVYTLVALILVFGWMGYELRARNSGVSQVLFAFSALFAVFLFAAAFGLY